MALGVTHRCAAVRAWRRNLLARTVRGRATAAAEVDSAVNAATDPILQPYQLRGLTLRNRILSTSHAPNYVDPGGMPGKRYQRYHEEKARGGLALTMFGGSSTVSPDSPSAFGQINCSTDAVIPYFQDLAAGVHAHGAKTMIQLTHMGWRTADDVADWLPVVAPSRARESAHRAFAREMDEGDIRRIVRDFGSAAWRAKEGGLDGIEIFASGHLIDSFWSQRTNRRTDRYGGSLTNRVRFALEVLEEVRRRVGSDYVVGMRVLGKATPQRPGDIGWGLPGMLEEDLTHEECLKIAGMLAETGMVDFFNVNAGSIDTDNRLASAIPSMYAPLAPHLEVAASFKRFLNVPVMHACRIIDLTTARRAISEGMLDMIGMTRAQIADPHLVNKLRAGKEDRIRPCVGAGYCLDRIYVGQDALCIHNAASGREHIGIPHVIERSAEAPRKVVVVGGGPAGLEAARVSALRGHQVVLFEAGKTLGGQVRLAQRATWRRDLGGIADWLASEVELLGVEVRLNTYATAEDVLAEAPDVVIVSAGGIPDDLGFEGPNVVSVWDVLSESVPVGEEVLVFDGVGRHQGPSCAEHLATAGRRVELATPDRRVAESMGALNWPVFLRNLYRLGVTLTPDHRLEVVEPLADGRCRALLRNEYSGVLAERIVDSVVVEHGTLPCTELFDELRAASSNGGHLDLEALTASPPRPQRAAHHQQAEDEATSSSTSSPFLLFRVGDAVTSRNIHAAIYDSLRLCKDL